MWFIDYTRNTKLTCYGQKLGKITPNIDQSKGESGHFTKWLVVRI